MHAKIAEIQQDFGFGDQGTEFGKYMKAKVGKNGKLTVAFMFPQDADYIRAHPLRVVKYVY
jgi:hypothetical protein